MGNVIIKLIFRGGRTEPPAKKKKKKKKTRIWRGPRFYRVFLQGRKSSAVVEFLITTKYGTHISHESRPGEASTFRPL